MEESVLFLCTGGTIDKCYPRTQGGYSFEFGDPAVGEVVRRIRPSLSYLHTVVSVCREDSQDVTDDHRNEMLSRIVAGQSKMVVLTHGTDTMIETGKYLEVRLGKDSDKRVVLTGSFLPEKFKDSDADFNIGTALGALPHLPPGVYIAMQGRVSPVSKVWRCPQTGAFLAQKQL